MSHAIFAPKRAKIVNFWKTVALTVALCMPLPVAAQGYQTIVTETPVASYYAYPDDTNFVPATEFMAGTTAVNYDENVTAVRADESAEFPGVAFGDKPAVICRDFGCTTLNDKITRPFLFNSMANMFMMNTHSKVHVCEADPFTRSCLASGISFPTTVGVGNAMAKIPSATINSVSVSTGLSKASIGVDFEFLLNGIPVKCSPTTVEIVIPNTGSATLMTREFGCRATADGATNASLLINIDYIDLDYGIMGGYYSFGLQGSASGGGTGYALLKMEYTNKGMKIQKQTMAKSGGITIQPGEYAVEPMER